jgi:hypothetical protein
MLRATFILVGVGSLVAMELGTPPRIAKAVNQPLPQSTVGAGDSQDTLAKADRLEIPYFQNELPIQPISFAERMPPADSAPVISKEASRIVSGNRHDARTWKVAFVRPKPTPKIPDSRPRPKTADSKTADSKTTASKTTASKTVVNTIHSKAPMDIKPCRPNAFDGLLKALNLPSGCDA